MSGAGPDRRTLLAGGAAFAALAACSKPPAAGGKTKLRFSTDWRAQAEQGGFYQAVAKGLYVERDLDVSIIQGGPGSNVPQLIAAGAVELGLGSSAFMPMNLAAEGVPVKAVQASFQKDPQVLIAHDDPALKTIADLKGRPTFISDASITAWWAWARAKFGFTDAQIRKYTFNSAPFISDPRSVQQGYVTSEPATLAKAGVKTKVFLLADNGLPGYAAMILAPNALIEKEPAAIKAFVEATNLGWKDYLHGDPGPGDALIQKDNPEISAESLEAARKAMVQYGIVDGGDATAQGIGVMTEARWKEFFDAMSAVGVYKPDLDWRAAFTTQFLPGGAG